MPVVLKCPQGHQWEAIPGGETACPKCGAAPIAREHSQATVESVVSTPSLSAESADKTTLPEHFGRYRILKQLGKGGMGAVYLAHDSQLDRDVALKVPHFSADEGKAVLERFYREARSAATLHHPNICPVFDVGELDGKPYLTMAYIEGRPLSKYIEPDKPLTPRQIATLVRKLAQALQEAHQRGVIHRDLKPSNIMINTRGEPVIMDFGLAKRLNKDVRITGSGTIMGMPAYMSPEQVNGDLEAMGPHSDIYSLGVILYELLAGRLPFEGPMASVLGQITMKEPDPPSKHRPGIDPRLEAVCLKAMAKQVKDRYGSMGDFAGALLDYMKAGSAGGTVALPRPEAAFAELTDNVRIGATLRHKPAAAAARSAGRKRKPPWAALVAIAVPLLILLGVIIYVQTDHGTIKIELSDPNAKVEIKVDGSIEINNIEEPIKLKAGEHGLTVTGKNFETVAKTFTVKRGENPAVKITLEPRKTGTAPKPLSPRTATAKPGASPADPDRKAAEWVISLGGGVRVNGETKGITAKGDLPAAPFTLVVVSLNNRGDAFTDSDLVRFAGLKGLAELHLVDTGVTDTGIKHLKGMRGLAVLGLHSTKVTDAGIEHLKGLASLTHLHLNGTKVTDAGIEHLKGMKGLTLLHLAGTGVTDLGLEHLKALTGLTELSLAGTKVTDAGLENLKSLTGLKALMLDGTQVGDTGLAHLKDGKQLTYLEVRRTKVTLPAIEAFHKARPACKIVHDKGTIEAKDIEREVAKKILGRKDGNSVHLMLPGEKELRVQKLAEIPPGPFALDGINDYSPFSDADVKALEPLRRLRVLNLLRGHTITTEGLRSVLAHKDTLAWLRLDSGPTTDEDLKVVGQLTELDLLALNHTKVTNDGLKHLAGLKKLHRLELADTAVTDGTIDTLAEMKSLVELNVKTTKLTAPGLKKLAAALPACKITHDDGVIQPTAVADPDRKAAEWAISIGGTVRVNVNGENRDIKAAADLPKGGFALLQVNLYANQNVTDTGVANLKGCDSLTHLNLGFTQVGDVGLAQLKDYRTLMYLYLAGTQVTNGGLEHFKNCNKLHQLNLSQTQVTDAGLVNFKDCSGLSHLTLHNTQVTKAGLAYFRDCKQLTSLNVKQTKVTKEGVAAFAKVQPQCKIEWDGPTIEPTVVADPDRKAAEYVLSIGGRVGVNGGRPEIRQPAELPREPFTLTTVWLESGALPDAGAAVFKDCKNLTHLFLLVPVSDAGLANFANCKDLTFLRLSSGSVTEAGLAHFKHCQKLTMLNLSGMPVTDAGLAHFKNCKLVALDLGSSRVTAGGLAPFQDSQSLSIVSLYGTPVGNEGAARFKGCRNLTWLNLIGSGAGPEMIDEIAEAIPACHIKHGKGTIAPRDESATDRAAAHGALFLGGRIKIKGNPKWITSAADLPQTFSLTGVDIAFTTYAHDPDFFKNCKELTELDVRATKITGPACREFAKTHPRCRIQHKDGIIEPTAAADPDRKAAEYVLSIRGRVKVNGQEEDIKTKDELPKDRFSVTGIGFPWVPNVTDADVVHFKDCKKLAYLSLGSSQVTNAGLACFKDCKTLTNLYLFNSQMGDAGMANFKDCDLRVLILGGSRVTDAGMVHFKDCKNLTNFDVSNTTVGDAGLANFKDCKNLTELWLNNTRMGDAGLAYFKHCKNLTVLRVQKTKVTKEAVAEFAKAQPQCKVVWDGGTIEPRAVADAEAAFPALEAKFKASGVTFESFAKEVAAFKAKHGGTPAAIKAAARLMELPSPLDQLDPAKIPEDAKAAWRASGREPPGELVGVLGEHRGRHWGMVNSVAWNHHRNLIASAGTDGLIGLWNPDNFEPVKLLKGHTAAANSLAFTSDGRWLVSSGVEIIVWDIDTKNEARRYALGGSRLTLSNDDERMAVTWGHEVVVLGLANGKEICRCVGHTGQADSLAFVPGSRQIISGGHDDTIRLWDGQTGKELGRFECQPPPSGPHHVSSLLVSADGRHLLSFNHDGMVRYWDVATRQQLRSFEPGIRSGWAVAASPDGKQALSAHTQVNELVLWDIAAGKRIWTAAAPGPRSVAFARDGKRAVSAHADGTVRLWDVETGKEVQPAAIPPLNRCEFTPNCRELIAGSSLGGVYVWDFAGRTMRGRVEAHDGGVWSLSITPDGRQVLSAGRADGRIRIWDLQTTQLVRTLEGLPAHGWVVCSPQGTMFVSAGGQHFARVWDLGRGQELRQLEGHTENVHGLAFSPDGRRIVTGSADKTLRFWDATTGRELRRLEGPTSWINAVAYAPDGSYLATSCYDGNLWIWRRVESGSWQPATVKAHEGPFDVAISPSGSFLATAGFNDGRVATWDPVTGKKLSDRQLPGPVITLRFASDGRHLATANANGTVYILRIADRPRADRGLEFDGKTSYVEIPSLALEPDRPYTIEAWVKYDAPTSDHFYAVACAYNPACGASLFRWPQGQTHFGARSGRRQQFEGEPQPTGKTGWMHVAGVWDGKTARMYVDGKRQPHIQYDERPAEQVKAQNQPWMLGGEAAVPGQGKTSLFAGLMAEVRISKIARYDSDFTPSKRHQPDKDTIALYHCDDGQGDRLTDTSGNSHHGRIVGAKWVKASEGTRLPTPDQAKQQQADAAKQLGVPVTIENSLGMKLAPIPAGEFVMGAPRNEKYAYDDEMPQHTVRITRPFHMGVHEVTQGQYEKVMGKNPSEYPSGKGGGPEHPVEMVSWHDAVEFCRRLSDRAEEKQAGRSYRLPTEAEWEYACRAGTTGPYYFGGDVNKLGEHAWHKGNAPEKTQPVGRKPPNAWGLHDLLGNVAEWCADWYDSEYYKKSPQADPRGPGSGKEKITRGGGFYGGPRECRAAVRPEVAPTDRHDDLGFRVVMEQKSP